MGNVPLHNDAQDGHETDMTRSCRRLVAKVMWQAVRDLGNFEFQEVTKTWLYSKQKAPWSFEWCCAVLDLKPDTVRSRAFARMVHQRLRYSRPQARQRGQYDSSTG